MSNGSGNVRVVNGRIERGRARRRRLEFLRHLAWRRVCCVLVVAAIFIATNPANQNHWKYLNLMMMKSGRRGWRKRRRHRVGGNEYRNQFCRWSFPMESDPSITNFLFFSLNTQDLTFDNRAVQIEALGQSWRCPFNADNVRNGGDHTLLGEFCEIVGTQWAHGKPVWWDETDWVYTTHRTICWLLVLSFLITFWSISKLSAYSLLPLLFGNTSSSPFVFLDSLHLSIFFPVSASYNSAQLFLQLLSDLFYTNVAVFPALEELDQILPRLDQRSFLLVSGGNNKEWDFMLNAWLLIVGIGGGSNLLASALCSSQNYHCHVTGFSPVIAACLAYYHRISTCLRPSIPQALIQLGGGKSWSQIYRNHYHHAYPYTYPTPTFQPALTAAGLYWSSIALLIIRQRHFYPSTLQQQQQQPQQGRLPQYPWFPSVVAWLLAGCMGSLFAKYHLENVSVWGDILRLFGLT